jgi:PGF-pre-PGF domain-containing protein
MVVHAQYLKKRYFSAVFYSGLKNWKSFVFSLCLFFFLLGTSVCLVEAANVAPSLDLIGPKNVQENASLSFTLLATDANNDSLEYSSSNLPAGSQLDASSGLFEWTPSYDQAKKYQVEFIVSDGEYNDSEYVEIAVSNTNRIPQLQAIADYTINENEFLEIILGGTDDDGDILEYSKSISSGLIVGNKFTWTPSYEREGEHLIRFAVNDGVDEVYQTAKVTVENVNRKPILFSISDEAVAPKSIVDFSLDAYDFDDDSLTFNNETPLPIGSSFNSGYFAWIPYDTDFGVYTLKFNVSDGIDTSETKEMRIFVDVSAQPPVFGKIVHPPIYENELLSFKVDVIGKKLSYEMPLYPDDTSSFSLPSLVFGWTPSYEQSGIHLVEFGVQEKAYPTFKAFKHLFLDVQNVNRAPEIGTIIGKSVNETETIFLNITATDPDGDSLSYSNNPSLGKFQGNTFIWTPGYSESGPHAIDFIVSDGELTNSTSVMIIVEDTNMPPELSFIGSKTAVFNNTLEFTLTAFDVDGDELEFNATGLPPGATFNATSKLFRWKPLESQKGKYTIGFSVSDQEFTDYETILVTVAEPVVVAPDPSSSGGGGSGGGGSSQNTGEKFENIDFKDYTIKYVSKDRETTFAFDDGANSITSITFTSKLNGGQVKAIIENLKGPTTLTDEVPSGIVYKNMNIWMGDSKFSSDVISGADVRFKVEKQWIKDNNIKLEHIVLSRHSNGEWEYLDTTISEEDATYIYFISKTPGFSPFAIVSYDVTEFISQEEVLNSEVDNSDSVIPVEPADEHKSHFPTFVFMSLLALLVIGIVGKKYRRNLEGMLTHITNTDGKRYRRLKR